MIRHGQEVLEVFEIEKADLRFHDHVDRHHQEQLLQDDKERTLKKLLEKELQITLVRMFGKPLVPNILQPGMLIVLVELRKHSAVLTPLQLIMDELECCF